MLQVSLILLVTKETGTSMILLFMNSYLVSGCDIDHCDIDHWLVDPQQIDFFCNKSYFTFTITSKKISLIIIVITILLLIVLGSVSTFYRPLVTFSAIFGSVMNFYRTL